MPLRHPQFRRGLLLRDELLLCFLQHNQPVPIPLGHLQNSLFFQLPSVTLSTGHFYLAQIGHSHVAPTFSSYRVDNVDVASSTATTLDAKLSISATATSVEVKAAPVLLQTQDASIAVNVEEKLMRDAPIPVSGNARTAS